MTSIPIKKNKLYRSNSSHPSSKHYYIVQVTFISGGRVQYEYIDTNHDAIDVSSSNDLSLSIFRSWYDPYNKNEYKQISNNYNI